MEALSLKGFRKAQIVLAVTVLFVFVYANKIQCKTKENPHKITNRSFEIICQDCHNSDPFLNEGSIENKKCQSYCKSCHTVPASCLLISSKQSTAILKDQMQYLGLPLFSETISCGSCHFFHERKQQRVNEKRLNSFYSNFWYRAQQINPHRSGVFCQLCHETGIGLSSDALKLKFQADRVAVCLQCHDGKKARADNHPVRVSPSKDKGVHVPEGFPLYDGKITCLTCHEMPCQGGDLEAKLLRGGPYEKRVDACLSCHSKERYQAVNPHIMIDPNGRIMKNKCLYCHII